MGGQDRRPCHRHAQVCAAPPRSIPRAAFPSHRPASHAPAVVCLHDERAPPRDAVPARRFPLPSLRRSLGTFAAEEAAARAYDHAALAQGLVRHPVGSERYFAEWRVGLHQVLELCGRVDKAQQPWAAPPGAGAPPPPPPAPAQRLYEELCGKCCWLELNFPHERDTRLLLARYGLWLSGWGGAAHPDAGAATQACPGAPAGPAEGDAQADATARLAVVSPTARAACQAYQHAHRKLQEEAVRLQELAKTVKQQQEAQRAGGTPRSPELEAALLRDLQARTDEVRKWQALLPRHDTGPRPLASDGGSAGGASAFLSPPSRHATPTPTRSSTPPPAQHAAGAAAQQQQQQQQQPRAAAAPGAGARPLPPDAPPPPTTQAALAAAAAGMAAGATPTARPAGFTMARTPMALLGAHASPAAPGGTPSPSPAAAAAAPALAAPVHSVTSPLVTQALGGVGTVDAARALQPMLMARVLQGPAPLQQAAPAGPVEVGRGGAVAAPPQQPVLLQPVPPAATVSLGGVAPAAPMLMARALQGAARQQQPAAPAGPAVAGRGGATATPPPQPVLLQPVPPAATPPLAGAAPATMVVSALAARGGAAGGRGAGPAGGLGGRGLGRGQPPGRGAMGNINGPLLTEWQRPGATAAGGQGATAPLQPLATTPVRGFRCSRPPPAGALTLRLTRSRALRAPRLRRHRPLRPPSAPPAAAAAAAATPRPPPWPLSPPP